MSATFSERPPLRSVLIPILDAFKNKNIYEEALMAGGNFMVSHAQGNAPTRTGYMKSQIGFEKSGSNKIIFYAGAYYSKFVELGHRTRGGGYVGARPFMEPAVTAGIPFIYAEILKRAQRVR